MSRHGEKVITAVMQLEEQGAPESCSNDDLDSTLDILYSPLRAEQTLGHTSEHEHKEFVRPARSEQVRSKSVQASFVQRSASARLQVSHVQASFNERSEGFSLTWDKSCRRLHVRSRTLSFAAAMTKASEHVAPSATALRVSKTIGAADEERLPPKPLQDNLPRFHSLCRLVLRGIGLSRVPEALADMKHVKLLDLSSNAFRSWPHACSSMKGLEHLDLSRNVISTPPEFQCSGLTQLKTLKLSANRLRSVPFEVSFLTNLEALYMDRNLLQQLPTEISSSNLPRLSLFTCFGNPMEAEERKVAAQGLATIRQVLDTRSRSGAEHRELLKAKLLQKREHRKAASKQPRLRNPIENHHGSHEMVLKRARLTKCLDLRLFTQSMPPAMFDNALTGVREVLVDYQQLPFLVQQLPSGVPDIDLSPAWKVVLGMKDLLVLWIFGEDLEQLRLRIPRILRQLRLVFNVVNLVHGKWRRQQLGFKVVVVRSDCQREC